MRKTTNWMTTSYCSTVRHLTMTTNCYWTQHRSTMRTSYSTTTRRTMSWLKMSRSHRRLRRRFHHNLS
jgi:hypothetical protein